MLRILTKILLLFLLPALTTSLTNCPQQCICQEYSIACSCEGAENPELIISSLGSTYITSLIVHTCDKVTVLNGSFSGVVLVERLSFIAIGRLFFEPHAFKNILQSPRQFVIDESHIASLAPVSFAGLSHIDHFWIRNSRIDVIAMEAFHYLTNIDYIYFHKTKIGRIERKAFSKMYQINHLYFKQSIKIEMIESEAFSGSQIDEFIIDNAEIESAHDSFLINIMSANTVIRNTSVHMISRNDNDLLENFGGKEEFIERCQILESKFSQMSPLMFGCVVTEISNSKIDKITILSKSITSTTRNSIIFSNSSITSLDSFSFSNCSLELLTFSNSTIGTVHTKFIESAKINQLVFENSTVQIFEPSSIEKSKIRSFHIDSMDIGKFDSQSIHNCSLGHFKIYNTKINKISGNLIKNSKIDKFEIDGSRINHLDSMAFHGKNEIESLSITESDLATPKSIPILSSAPSDHPTHLTLANNTIDCTSASCSINSFLLNSPKHPPLFWQVSNNKCRPPKSSNPCVSPRIVDLDEYGIKCRISWQVAECACTNSEARLPFDYRLFGGDVSVVIIGDCDKLLIGDSGDNDEKSRTTISQIYIFRTMKCHLFQLPKSLKVLKVFHSSVSFDGTLIHPLQKRQQIWEISESAIENFSPNSLSNLNLKELNFKNSRVSKFPNHISNSKIDSLSIDGSFFESTRPIFEITKRLKMQNSIVFSSPRGLGTISSAQLQNNTLLDCCSHPILENFRSPMGTEIDIDPRCDQHFYGIRCDFQQHIAFQPNQLAIKSSFKKGNLLLIFVLVVILSFTK